MYEAALGLLPFLTRSYLGKKSGERGCNRTLKDPNRHLLYEINSDKIRKSASSKLRFLEQVRPHLGRLRKGDLGYLEVDLGIIRSIKEVTRSPTLRNSSSTGSPYPKSCVASATCIVQVRTQRFAKDDFDKQFRFTPCHRVVMHLVNAGIDGIEEVHLYLEDGPIKLPAEELLFSEWAGDGWGTDIQTRQTIHLDLSFVSLEDAAPFERFFDIVHESIAPQFQCTLTCSTSLELLELGNCDLDQAPDLWLGVTGPNHLPAQDRTHGQLLQIGLTWSGLEMNEVSKKLDLGQNYNSQSGCATYEPGQKELSDLVCPLHEKQISFHETSDLETHIKLEHPELAILGVSTSLHDSMFKRQPLTSTGVKPELSMKADLKSNDDFEKVDTALVESKSSPAAVNVDGDDVTNTQRKGPSPGSSSKEEAPGSPHQNEASRSDADVSLASQKRKRPAAEFEDSNDEPLSQSRKRSTRTFSQGRPSTPPKKTIPKKPQTCSPKTRLLEKSKQSSQSSAEQTTEQKPKPNEPDPVTENDMARHHEQRYKYNERSTRSTSRSIHAVQNPDESIHHRATRSGKESNSIDLSTHGKTSGKEARNTMRQSLRSFSTESAAMVETRSKSPVPKKAPKNNVAEGKVRAKGRVDAKIDAGADQGAVSEQESELPEKIEVNPLPAVHKPRFPVPKTVNGTQLFRTSSKRPIREGELLSDSDHEVETSWLVKSHHLAIDEMRDATKEQKRFTVMFNEHFHKEQLNGQRYVPDALLRFASAFSQDLKEKDMRRELIQKLMAMKLENLVTEADILKCLKVVDSASARAIKKRKLDVQNGEDEKLAKAMKIEDSRSDMGRVKMGYGCPKCKEAVEDARQAVFCDSKACASPMYHWKCAGFTKKPTARQIGHWTCPGCKVYDTRSGNSKPGSDQPQQDDDPVQFVKQKEYYIPMVESAGLKELRSLLQDIDNLRQKVPNGPSKERRETFWDDLKAAANRRIKALESERADSFNQLQKRWTK